MPDINRIRVNNVKYNFGTQFYDDFTMRMYGKNTLYDLANGGGKSVLMLLLMQNLLPNCTLDDKQPIEKLFRTGSGNTTIHSLIEWKLDPSEIKEGYRYMTTGFCARKAKEEEGSAEKGVAQIEYFNYCIFYREYNRNDIINLPLVKDGERISYQALRNYLKELEHRDNALSVKIFDRKGEYQRFISGYGLHESQWEIVRGINKTEGHVRTYFESNYRTGRKVVEDLLIEEIIEKAFLVKTERDEGEGESMARLLVDIREQLSTLASKKKDIASYDHEIELVNLLIDRVNSFTDIFSQEASLTKSIANICVTGEAYVRDAEVRKEALLKENEEKRARKDVCRARIECLRVSRDIVKLNALSTEIEEIAEKLTLAAKDVEDLKKELTFKKAANEYLEYVDEKKKYDALVLEESLANEEISSDDFKKLVASIKLKLDELILEAGLKFKLLNDEWNKKREELSSLKKELSEAEILLAVSNNKKAGAVEQSESLAKKISQMGATLNDSSFINVIDKLSACESEIKETETKLGSIKEAEEALQVEKENYDASLKELETELSELYMEKKGYLADEESFKISKQKLDNMYAIYIGDDGSKKDYSKLRDTVQKKITESVIYIQQKTEEIAKVEKRIESLKDNVLIEPSDGAKKVIDYIETRHSGFAMHGMDYLSALSKETKEELLTINPELPYGVVVKDFDKLIMDESLKKLNTGKEAVLIYDMDSLKSEAIYPNSNAFFAHSEADFFTDEGTREKLIADKSEDLLALKDDLARRSDMEKVMRLDMTFIITHGDERFALAGEKLRDVNVLITTKESEKEKLLSEIRKLEKSLKDKALEKENVLSSLDELNTDREKLLHMKELSSMMAEQEDIILHEEKDAKRLEALIAELTKKNEAAERDELSLSENVTVAKKESDKFENLWNEKYAAYYTEGVSGSKSETLEALDARFNSYIAKNKGDNSDSASRKLLMETIYAGMNRILRNISSKGIDTVTLENEYAKGHLIMMHEKALQRYETGILDAEKKHILISDKLKNKENEKMRLEGSTNYAIDNIKAAFGYFNLEEGTDSALAAKIEETDSILKNLTAEAKASEEKLRKYERNLDSMLLLYKDAKRIAERNEIDLTNAIVLDESEEMLHEEFEEILVKYDKQTKLMDRARAELLRFKSQTSETLSEMGSHELSATIRDDVTVPANYDETVELLKNLSQITGYIALEKERVETSLVDMERLKENFEEQCLQRCLDVKTELDKLPKLSKIVLEGETIQMVGLTIPYVKDEFMRDRMSQYIDHIVSEADNIRDDKDRMKYIRTALELKRLFSVIVTDMNAIKLSLYKRERIKEQSRYLKYEEAVGSTGQSQGIYIQFLIAIINYISGMYSVNMDSDRTKTIFIDNPFGAAKDIYIWEPIFEMLKINKVQLIVPARGATPAITGRFDVNYVLGQQMVGKKQMTVVVNYTSKTNQEELEYHDLEFEQTTFDFI